MSVAEPTTDTLQIEAMIRASGLTADDARRVIEALGREGYVLMKLDRNHSEVGS